jgi:uncharacterized protein YukE
MTIIEMNTDEARANSALLAQYIGEFRGIKNEIASNTTTVANNWQSQASLEFQSLMQDIVVEMEGKITNLETSRVWIRPSAPTRKSPGNSEIKPPGAGFPFVHRIPFWIMAAGDCLFGGTA